MANQWRREPRMISDLSRRPTVDPDGELEAQTPIYLDEGCTFFPACLECPLSVCPFEVGQQGISTPVRIARLITEDWHLPGADRAQLFKAAQLCLKRSAKAEAVFGPEFMEVLDAYGSTQGGR